jgi:uncharacterized protein (DUF736 family)
MAIVGIFKATKDGYEGTLEILTLKAKLTIEPAKKTNDNQPPPPLRDHRQEITDEITWMM